MALDEIIEKFQNKEHFPEHAEWISEHLDRFFEESEITVFHEMLSPDFHLDVYFINSEKSDFNILLTSGMSTYAMTVDERAENPDELKFAELMMLLPKDIEFENFQTSETENGWIVSMLKQSARFPHHHDTWLQVGHTLQADADMNPYSTATDFVGVSILLSVTFEENFTVIKKEDRTINIYTVFPLYQNELEHKIEYGFNGLIDLLQESNAQEVFDNERENMMD